MADALVLLLAVTASYLGFAAIAVAMPANRQLVRGHSGAAPDAPYQGRLRLSGALLLVLSLAATIGVEGASFGVPLWALFLSLGAIAVTVTLSWAPRTFHWLVAAAEPPHG